MGNTEKDKTSNSGKSSSPVVVSMKDQNKIHAYPDWTTMQAFYGSHVAVPPYLNSAVASPHVPPPYLWGPPQSVIPPYAGTYAAFYANGGVYAHLGVPLAGTSLTMETLVKSSGKTDGGFMKKSKDFDGFAVSIDNGSGDSAEHATDNKLSDSDESEGSSNESNGVTLVVSISHLSCKAVIYFLEYTFCAVYILQIFSICYFCWPVRSCKKRSRQESPNQGNGSSQKKSSSMHTFEDGNTGKVIGAVPSANAPAKTIENTNPTLELNDPSHKSSPANEIQPSIQNGDLLLNERDLKWERRKQSKRESARRSRLRKQAEAEELAIKVKTLSDENMSLTSEINKL